MPESAPQPTHFQLFVGMQQVALSSFGGGLSAWSERIVVEDRQWMNKEEFITGLTVARLFPGPNQINMAVYIGSRFHGLTGAIAGLPEVVAKHWRAGDVVLVLGAGDIDRAVGGIVAGI